MIQSINEQLEKIIEIREAGKLKIAKRTFLLPIKQISQDDSIYPRAMAEYIILLRLEAKELLGQALKLGQELLSFEQNKPAVDPLSIRSVSNTLVDLGGFEAAIPLLKKLSTLYPDNSLRLGETQAHLSLAYLRVGRVEEASKLIKVAIKNIKDNTARENYIEVRISYAYMVQSLIFNSLGQKDSAIKSAEKSLEIANHGNAIHRVSQAKELLSFLKAA